MTWGLAGYEHSHGGGTSIDCLMLLSGSDLESFAGVKDEVMVFDFECEFSFEDEEELARVNVGVANLGGSGRHEFFNDAEFGSFDEVPAVAVGCLRASPLVMLGGFCADDLGWQSSAYLGFTIFSCRLRSCRSRVREAESWCRRALLPSRKRHFSRR